MKNIYIVFLSLFSLVAIPCMGQEEEVPFVNYEVMPSYIGGESEMYKFIEDRFYFPQDALEKGIFGRVILRFVVSKTGDVYNVEDVRGIHPDCDSLSVDIVRSMPQWEPGYQISQGKKYYVPVNYTLPIMFSEFKKVDGDTIYWKTDLSPHFEGGNKSVTQYIEDAAGKNVLDGEGLVRFVVTKDGTVRDAIVVKETRPFQQKGELLKVINSMTTWRPAIRDGKLVDSFVVLPLSFEKKELVFIIDPPLPSFPGGEEALYKFVYSNIQFSGELPFKGEQKGLVKFIVDKKGKVKNPEIVKSIHPVLDKEVLRAISLMPDWISASSDGKNVDSEFLLPIKVRFNP